MLKTPHADRLRYQIFDLVAMPKEDALRQQKLEKSGPPVGSKVKNFVDLPSIHQNIPDKFEITGVVSSTSMTVRYFVSGASDAPGPSKGSSKSTGESCYARGPASSRRNQSRRVEQRETLVNGWFW